MKKFIYSAVFLLGHQAAVFAGVWSQTTTVTGLYVYAEGSAFMTTANNENPDACASSRYLFLDSNAKNFKYLYATALAAYTSNSTVSLRYDGCSNDNQYPVIVTVAVPDKW